VIKIGVTPKPCPFCGHSDIIAKSETLANLDVRVYAECGYCRAQGRKITGQIYITYADRAAAAFKAWNNRYEEVKTDE